MTQKSYHGYRVDGDLVVKVIEVGRDDRDLDPRRDLYDHSPTGFECGYAGSGPAQLALAILADFLGDDERALQLYQPFKAAVISSLPRQEWVLTALGIEDALRRLQAPMKTRLLLKDIENARIALWHVRDRLQSKEGDWCRGMRAGAWQNAIEGSLEVLDRIRREVEK